MLLSSSPVKPIRPELPSKPIHSLIFIPLGNCCRRDSTATGKLSTEEKQNIVSFFVETSQRLIANSCMTEFQTSKVEWSYLFKMCIKVEIVPGAPTRTRRLSNGISRFLLATRRRRVGHLYICYKPLKHSSQIYFIG